MQHGKNIVAATLAIMALLGFLAAFFCLGWAEVPTANEKYLMISLTALISCVSTGFGYFLGSSFGSSQKNQIFSPGAAPAVASPGAEAGFIRLPLLLGLALLCLFLGACATNPATPTANDTPLQTAGKSLLAVKSTIVTTATSADSLCMSMVLDADKCAMAKRTYEQSKPAYDSAVDAYLLLSQGGDPAAFAASLQRLQDIANNMLQLTGGAH